VNSPESTRPCHAVTKNWNGTLDIAALPSRTEGLRRSPRRAAGRPGRGTRPPAVCDATERACAAKKWPSGRVPPERFWQRRFGIRTPVTREFCRSLFVLARRKLARNQMFRARCVPNMYLFGTFSAQNPPKIAPSPPPSRANFGRYQAGERLPRFRAQGARRGGFGGIRPPGGPRRH
jgi:hypothetical protein